jgi:hypothetical protein
MTPSRTKHRMERSAGIFAILNLAAACFAAPLFASSSAYTVRLEDPRAVYLTPDKFSVAADGKADDSAAIQQAIDRVQESTGEGIVFLPSGRYRISKTIYVWPGIRVIGYGPTRPVFYLAADTPGFQQGMGYMVFFTGAGQATIAAARPRQLQRAARQPRPIPSRVRCRPRHRLSTPIPVPSTPP